MQTELLEEYPTTSMTTHIVRAHKKDRITLIEEFKKKKYFFPMELPEKAYYRGALAIKFESPVFLPKADEIVAPDYRIRHGSYFIKPEVKAVRHYANIPIPAVKYLTEEVVFKVVGKPLWCENSEADCHYYLILLQHVAPATYNEIKGTTHVERHTLTDSNEARLYLNIQKDMGKILDIVKSHTIKLSHLKIKAAEKYKDLQMLVSTTESLLVGHVESHDGVQNLSPSTVEVFKRIMAVVADLGVMKNVMDAKNYYAHYSHVNSVAINALGFAFRITEDCPPPLSEQETPPESFEQITTKLSAMMEEDMIRRVSEMQLRETMPVLHYLPKATNLSKTATQPRLVRIAKTFVQGKKQIPLAIIKEMLKSSIWKFDIKSRTMLPTDHQSEACVIPTSCCYQYLVSPEGQKMIQAALQDKSEMILEAPQIIPNQINIQSVLALRNTGNAMLEELTTPVINEAMNQQETSRADSGADNIVNGLISQTLNMVKDDVSQLRDIVKKRRTEVGLAFPPVSSVSKYLGKWLLAQVQAELQKQSLVSNFLKSYDTEGMIAARIHARAQDEAAKIVLSPDFIEVATELATVAIRSLDAFKTRGTDAEKDFYSTAAATVDQFIKASKNREHDQALLLYGKLSDLGLSETFQKSGISVSSAQTAGAGTSVGMSIFQGLLARINKDGGSAELSFAMQSLNIEEVITRIDKLQDDMFFNTFHKAYPMLLDRLLQLISDTKHIFQPLSVSAILMILHLLDVCGTSVTNVVNKTIKLNSTSISAAAASTKSLLKLVLSCLLSIVKNKCDQYLNYREIRTALDEMHGQQLIAMLHADALSLQVKTSKYTGKDFFLAATSINLLATYCATQFAATANKGMFLVFSKADPFTGYYSIQLPHGIGFTRIWGIVVDQIVGKHCGLPELASYFNRYGKDYFESREVTTVDEHIDLQKAYVIKLGTNSTVPSPWFTPQTSGSTTTLPLYSVFTDVKSALSARTFLTAAGKYSTLSSDFNSYWQF